MPLFISCYIFKIAVYGRFHKESFWETNFFDHCIDKRWFCFRNLTSSHLAFLIDLKSCCCPIQNCHFCLYFLIFFYLSLFSIFFYFIDFPAFFSILINLLSFYAFFTKKFIFLFFLRVFILNFLHIEIIF